MMETSNTSAPGFSGIGYQLLKHACIGWDKIWEGLSCTLISMYNTCLSLGHHPAIWKEASVTVIPKPDKPDYTGANAHHPISLLETMSKLLEKIITKRMQHEIVAHELIPTNQFGGRMHSSCLDAGLTLLHIVQRAQQVNLKCGILLFDIKGFFDNVTHDRMVNIIRKLGYSHEIVNWTDSFLKERKVCLHFNGILSEQRDQLVGVPQGSPLSPVLSITYTSSLLHKMVRWNNSSLGIYVDDGILFACAPDWEGVETLLHARYTVCKDWLRMLGLAIEPDKTEVMFFEKARECNTIPAPRHLLLPDREGSTYYSVMPAETLRYLGFFFQRRQKWDHHITIMANRARALIKALSVLGNTICGLSMTNWRLVMNAVCLPVLTYRCQLWYREGGKGVKAHVNRLQCNRPRVLTCQCALVSL